MSGCISRYRDEHNSQECHSETLPDLDRRIGLATQTGYYDRILT